MNGIVTLGFPEVSVVAHTIQLALAPVFLLAGIGAFLNVSVSRMARVVDRARVVEKLLPASTGAEHDRLVEEVRILDRRIKVVNRAILLTVTAAVLTCLVVILLFASNLISANLGTLKPSADLTSAELIPSAVPARCDKRGLLLIGDPPDLGPYVLPGNNYHVYDIPLFWANLRQDFERRTQAWAAAAR